VNKPLHKSESVGDKSEIQEDEEAIILWKKTENGNSQWRQMNFLWRPTLSTTTLFERGRLGCRCGGHDESEHMAPSLRRLTKNELLCKVFGHIFWFERSQKWFRETVTMIFYVSLIFQLGRYLSRLKLGFLIHF